tara:strand:+ start:8479 stop:9495 length:1017 start_codon:yes stop_codon:yes gene_type:complete
VRSNIEIINTSKYVSLADFVFSAVVSEKDYIEKFKSESSIIQKNEFESSVFIWFVKNNLKIKNNDIIFCHVELLNSLFSILNSSNLENLTLISAQSDISINRRFFSKKPKCITRWFSTNVNFKNENLHPIPLGINNDFISIYPVEYDFQKFIFKQNNEKANSIYSNFNINTRFLHRHFAMKYSKKNKKVIFDINKENKEKFINNLNEHKFILSPWGNGIDTHRIWEALYSNSIPITKDHTVFSSFKTLPIIFVKNYKQISTDIDKNDSLSLELADFKYWKSMILNSRNKNQTSNQNEYIKDIKELNFSFIKKRNKLIKFLRIKKQIKYISYRVFKKII